MRIGIDGGTWSNRRGYGRFLRELVGAVSAVQRQLAHARPCHGVDEASRVVGPKVGDEDGYTLSHAVVREVVPQPVVAVPAPHIRCRCA